MEIVPDQHGVNTGIAVGCLALLYYVIPSLACLFGFVELRAVCLNWITIVKFPAKAIGLSR